jgi:hypothetical protein
MFGLFAKGPSPETERQLVATAEPVLEFFGPAVMSQQVETNTGVINLAPFVRTSVRNALDRLDERYRIGDMDPSEFGKTMKAVEADLARVPAGQDKSYQVLAFLVAVNVGRANLLIRAIQESFPNHKQTNEFLNSVVKVACPGVAYVIGDDLPVYLRRAFPKFSSFFEASRSQSPLFPDAAELA